MSGWAGFINQDWLDQICEPVFEPGWAVVDPHHHIWSEPFVYDVPELLADLTEGHEVLGTVYMEAHRGYLTDGPIHLRPSGETAFMTRRAEEADAAPRICAGIVGAADLDGPLDELEQLLDAHVAAGKGRFCGIRSNIFVSFHPQTLAMYALDGAGQAVEQAGFLAGARLLAQRGLTLDLVCTHAQIEHVAKLASSVPTLRIIVDHFAPPVGFGATAQAPDELFAQWQRNLAALVPHENVFLKLGGCANPMMSPSLPDLHSLSRRTLPPTSEELADLYRPMFCGAVQALGPERCMFESNFPVDRTSSSYRVLWNAFKRLAALYSKDERTALLTDTAITAYRLELV